MTTDATQVTQADRDAAADYARDWNGARHETVAAIRRGGHDRWSVVQFLARHREAATATLTAQVEALTARAKASMEMAEDYHAAHIAERDRAQAAEAKVEVLREVLNETIGAFNAIQLNTPDKAAAGVAALASGRAQAALASTSEGEGHA